MRQQFNVAHVILDFLSVLFRDDANRGVLHRITAVTDDGGQRGYTVGVHHHFPQLPLHLILHLGAGGAACGLNRERQRSRYRQGSGRDQKVTFRHRNHCKFSKGNYFYGADTPPKAHRLSVVLLKENCL